MSIICINNYDVFLFWYRYLFKVLFSICWEGNVCGDLERFQLSILMVCFCVFFYCCLWFVCWVLGVLNRFHSSVTFIWLDGRGMVLIEARLVRTKYKLRWIWVSHGYSLYLLGAEWGLCIRIWCCIFHLIIWSSEVSGTIVNALEVSVLSKQFTIYDLLIVSLSSNLDDQAGVLGT